jgi:predicted XRE-type DNA-binding protein
MTARSVKRPATRLAGRKPAPPARTEDDALLALRLQAMQAIATHTEAMPGTQGARAEMLGISRPRLNALLNGRVELFGLDSLTQLALRAGLSVRLAIARPYARRRGR